MRFEYYHAGLDSVPKLSVDGTVANAIHFSHWMGNKTPPELKADTSTEIALNLVTSPDRNKLTQGIELVTNNHFDTDGVLSVWTVLTGERANELRDKLIAAAEAGDFSEYSTDDGVKASMVIQGSDQAVPDSDSGSPLAAYLAGENVSDDARAYELVLPEVERVLTRIEEFESLWREPWKKIVAAIESFERGSSRVTEFPDTRVSLVRLAPEIFSSAGFNPTRHAAPYTAISRYARGEVYLIATPVNNGWSYRIDYPYYSWAETVIRPPIARRDFSALANQLNELEKSAAGRWKLDAGELASAMKFAETDGTLGVSTLTPEDVVKNLSASMTAVASSSVARI